MRLRGGSVKGVRVLVAGCRLRKRRKHARDATPLLPAHAYPQTRTRILTRILLPAPSHPILRILCILWFLLPASRSMFSVRCSMFDVRPSPLHHSRPFASIRGRLPVFRSTFSVRCSMFDVRSSLLPFAPSRLRVTIPEGFSRQGAKAQGVAAAGSLSPAAEHCTLAPASVLETR